MLFNYFLIFLVHAPWLLLFAGAVLRLRRQSSRVRRLQFAGSVLLLAGVGGTLFLFDPNFGRDPYHVGNWSWFFERMESGTFWIGLMTFGLGYFLERRPRPGMRPWAIAGKLVAVLAILGAGALAYYVQNNISLPFIDLPWQPDRLIFTLGFYPFAIGYVLRGLAGEDAPVPESDL